MSDEDDIYGEYVPIRKNLLCIKNAYDQFVSKLAKKLPTKSFYKGAFQFGIIDHHQVACKQIDINEKILGAIDPEQFDDIKDWLSMMFDDDQCRPFAREFIEELSKELGESSLEQLLENVYIKDGFFVISNEVEGGSSFKSVQVDADEPVIIIKDLVEDKNYSFTKNNSVDTPILIEDVKHNMNLNIPYPVHGRPRATTLELFLVSTRFTAMATASLAFKTSFQLSYSTAHRSNIEGCQMTCCIPHYKQIKQLFCPSQLFKQRRNTIIAAQQVNSDGTKFMEMNYKLATNETEVTENRIVADVENVNQSVINWFWNIPQWLLDTARLGPKYYYNYFRYPVQYKVGIKANKDKPGQFTLVAIVKHRDYALPSRIEKDLKSIAKHKDETNILSSGRLQISVTGDIKSLNGVIWAESLNKAVYFDGVYSVTQFACTGLLDKNNRIYSKGTIEFRYVDPGPNCHPEMSSNPDYMAENKPVSVDFNYSPDLDMTRRYSSLFNYIPEPDQPAESSSSPGKSPSDIVPPVPGRQSRLPSKCESITETENLWHRKDMTKVKAIVFLHDKHVGTFIVRESKHHSAEVISIKVTNDGEVGHFIISTGSDGYSIADFERKFESLEKLLTYYTTYKDEEMQMRLRVPPSNESVVPAHPNIKVSAPEEIPDSKFSYKGMQKENGQSELEEYEYVSTSLERDGVEESKYVYMKSVKSDSKKDIFNQIQESRRAIYKLQESIRRVKEAKSKWMKHNMDLSDAETMLQYEAAGTFFVINTQNSTEHVLLVKLKDEGSVVAKFRILSQGNDVRIDDFNQSFKTIDELVGCYVCYQDKELKVQLKVLDDEHYTRIDDLSRRPSFDGPDTSSDLESSYDESIGQTEPPISPPLSPPLSPSNSISDFPCERQDLIYDIRGISDIEGNKSSFRRGSLRRAMPFFPSKRALTLSRDAQERNESTLKLLFEIDPKKCKLGPWDPYLHEVYIRLKKLKENSLKDEENQRLVDRTKLNAFESELESKIYSESREFIYKYLKKKYSRSLKTVASHMEEIAKQNLNVLRLPHNLELPYDKIRSEFKKMEKENLPERKLHYLIKAFGKLPKEQRDLKTMVHCISKISLQTLVYEADYIDNLVDPKMLHNESFQKAFVTFRNTILFLQQLNSSGEDYLSNLLKDKQKIVRLIILADENDCPVAQSIAIEPQKTIRDLYKICKSCTESILKLPCKEDEYILSIVDSNDELNSLDDNEDKVQLAIHGSGDYAEAISSDFINFIYHRNNAIQNFVYE